MKWVTGKESSPLFSWAARSVGLYSVTEASFVVVVAVVTTLGSHNDACPSPNLNPVILAASVGGMG